MKWANLLSANFLMHSNEFRLPCLRVSLMLDADKNQTWWELDPMRTRPDEN